MYKKIILFSSLFLLSACAIKDDPNIQQLFKEDEIYHASLLNTRKAQLIASLETKAVLTATYLNPVFDKKYCKNLCVYVEGGEYFFVGIYITDSEKHNINKKGYLLTLDGIRPSNIEPLDKDDSLRYQMPMVNNWSTYYKVKFPKVKGKKEIHLIFENDRFGKDILTFSKGQKPLFESLKYSDKPHN